DAEFDSSFSNKATKHEKAVASEDAAKGKILSDGEQVQGNSKNSEGVLKDKPLFAEENNPLDNQSPEKKSLSSSRQSKPESSGEKLYVINPLATEDNGERPENIANAVGVDQAQDMTAAIKPISGVSQAANQATLTSPAQRAEQIQALVDQMVDGVTQMHKRGLSETTITVKHPPLFENATFTLKEVSSAKGEFNIIFANLSPQARALIENQANQDLLRQGMQSKGTVVHIMAFAPEGGSNQPEQGNMFGHDEGQSDQGESQDEKDDSQQEQQERQQR
ncbi:MAG: hypothetical protein ACQEP8_01870, partial [Chlamydiota bacterium]